MTVPVDRMPRTDGERTQQGTRTSVVLAAVAGTLMLATLVTFVLAGPDGGQAEVLLATFDVVTEGLLVLAGCGALGVTVVLALLDDPDPATLARLRAAGTWWAALWALSLVYGQPIIWVGGVDELLGPGGGAVVAVVGAGTVALTVGRSAEAGARWQTVGLALAAMNAHLVSVHAVHEGHHEGSLLGIAAISVHVAAVSVWFGGLLALSLHAPAARTDAVLLGRFSRLALLCYAAVAVTGLLQVQDFIGLGALLTAEPYARVIDLKIALIAVVGALGLLHRTRTLPRLAQGRPLLFWRVVAVELLLLATAAGLAASLGSMPPS